MIKKSITYENFNGEMITEDFFFHLSMAELAELELSHKGGLKEALDRIMAAEDGKGIMDEFKNIIMNSYGKKSLDGRRFIKNDEVREEFMSTGAYSAFFMELVLNTDAAIEFINGVVPAGMAEEAARLAGTPKPEDADTREIVTRVQMDSMSQEELQNLGTRIASGTVKIAE